MKLKTLAILVAVIALQSFSTQAQPRGGGGPTAPNLSGSTAKLFGNNTSFSADLEMQAKEKGGGTITMPGSIAFSEGKSRFDMDLSLMKGGTMSPQMATQMKAMGMDKMVTISIPDKKVSLLVYPGLQAYVQQPIPDAAATSDQDFKIEVKELGKETLDGHACVKNQTTVTEKDGTKHDATVWNATDLKDFPIKIVQAEKGSEMIMLFKNVKLSKPDAKLFEAPAGFTSYPNMQVMMQEVMTKKFGGK
ncbi:MAG TPA: DUF4412 domain-containing protein [Roseimicrobium sp.]|nr:DUF4412 domain-containing protein [Roseimicrobium sp.]